MKNGIRKEIKYFFSNFYWVLVILILLMRYFRSMNYYINQLENRFIYIKDIIETGDFINMYILSNGTNFNSGPFSLFLLIFIFIILSNSSLSYYIDEKKGNIKYQYQTITKKEFIYSKIVTNIVLFGIVFIIPNLIILIYYSFFYSYDFPKFNDLSSSIRESIYVFTYDNNLYSMKYPILDIIIKLFLQPFLLGATIAFTIITFSLVAKKRSTLVFFSVGFMILTFAIYEIVSGIFKTPEVDSFEHIITCPYYSWVSSIYKQYLIPYFYSVLLIIIILTILFILFWRKNKDEI